MAEFNVMKAPFPWFGGKSKGAPLAWSLLGDCEHYVEPFFGSGAVLLGRPHEMDRGYYSETVNDLDGMVANFWRAIAADPLGVAHAASWPTSECDLHARHVRLCEMLADGFAERLMGDPDFVDVDAAGWWAWGQSCWIGSGWCSGRGPWWPDEDGKLAKNPDTRPEHWGVNRQLPHLGNNGQGVNHATTRGPLVGVNRQLPHLGNDGQGVNRQTTRGPLVGVNRKRPHLGNDGQGVNRQTTRGPLVGVNRKLPHLVGDGQGVNRQTTRGPLVGVSRRLPHLGSDGQGVNRQTTRQALLHPAMEGGIPVTSERLIEWLSALAHRLRWVRVLCGDWRRAVTGGASKTLSVRMGGGVCGVFLDPPYSGDVRVSSLYANDSNDVAAEVREWCAANGDDPQYRIIIAGFDTEHVELESLGWSVHEWFTDGFLTGGMANTSGDASKTQQKRERYWASPHCLVEKEDDELQLALFSEEGD